jgi:radical SAM protein with 4Fe4S-binding SPASM domain
MYMDSKDFFPIAHLISGAPPQSGSNSVEEYTTIICKERPFSDLRAPFVLVPQYFGCTVFDRSTSRYLPFDHEATQLLVRLCSAPINEILAEQCDQESQRQITRFFEDFYDLGFFTLDGKFLGSVLQVQPPEDHLVGPLAVHLEVVAACNLACKHCFAGDLPRREQALSINELDRLFQSLADMGAFRLGLTGGEPLLRRDLFDIIDLATSHGLHPCVTTNGLLISEEIAQEFGKRKLVWLNVSLEGATAESNDLVRGRGTFTQVRRNLALLAQHSRFTLAFTIMKSNFEEVEQCAELAYQVGAHTAVFRPLYPVGSALHNLNLMPTFQEYSQALNRLAVMATQSKSELCALDPFSPQARSGAQAITHTNYGCGAGNQVCSISISGDVNPCSFLGRDFVAANIRQQPFANIWHSSRGFKEIRALPGPGSSDDCESDAFSGGCRARALVFNGSVNAPDPWLTDQRAWRKSQTSCGDNRSPLYHPLTILEVTK